MADFTGPVTTTYDPSLTPDENVKACLAGGDRREPMKILPCPFCEGPPRVSSTEIQGNVKFRATEVYPDDGVFLDARVWCHECGADGPRADDLVYNRQDLVELERRAVALWNQRDNRHRSLYDGGEKDGLNEYPRANGLAPIAKPPT